ncbi:hypothetical protein E8E11_008378 [Didymella keratinophila]|nr:hypothetical protein E8E11_008378 [Didymella keratinophila]
MSTQLARFREVRNYQKAAIAARKDVQPLLDIAQDEFPLAEDLAAFWQWQTQKMDAEMDAKMAQKPPIEIHPPLSGQQILDTVSNMSSYDYGRCIAATGDLNCLSYNPSVWV